MFLALMRLTTTPVRRQREQRAFPLLSSIATQNASGQARLFEVLVPYVNPEESMIKGAPASTRWSMTMRIWAASRASAEERARERFKDYRFSHRRALLVSEGPVALRELPSERDLDTP